MANAPQVCYSNDGKQVFNQGEGKILHDPQQHYNQAYYPPANSAPLQRPKSQNPFGLSSLAFGALVALVACLVTGAIVGGAVGGTLGSKSANSASKAATTIYATKTSTRTAPPDTATATTTITTYAPTTTPTSNPVNYTITAPQFVSSLYLNCPAINGTTLQSLAGDNYTMICGVNYPGLDFLNLIAYTVEDCMQACSGMNNITGKTECRGVLFNAALSSQFETATGNCWVKEYLDNAEPDTGDVVTAMLVQQQS